MDGVLRLVDSAPLDIESAPPARALLPATVDGAARDGILRPLESNQRLLKPLPAPPSTPSTQHAAGVCFPSPPAPARPVLPESGTAEEHDVLPEPRHLKSAGPVLSAARTHDGQAQARACSADGPALPLADEAHVLPAEPEPTISCTPSLEQAACASPTRAMPASPRLAPTAALLPRRSPTAGAHRASPAPELPVPWTEEPPWAPLPLPPEMMAVLDLPTELAPVSVFNPPPLEADENNFKSRVEDGEEPTKKRRRLA